MGMERRGCVDQSYLMVNQQWEEPLSKAKPFRIAKRVVWEAYKRVKANQGSAGVDGESIAEFERDLQNNLYKLWNRMSSGSYFPPPVRTVEIPKDSGGTRTLGIPTVADRIAQMVAKMYLEPLVEPVERKIRKGSDVVTLSTAPVALQPPEGINSQVIVVVNIHDQKGREKCWATSYNFLRGQLVFRPETSAPQADTIQVLSFTPRPGTLETGKDHSFLVNLRYSLKNRDWGFVNLEIGEGGLDTGWAPWYVVVVPVSKGTGLVRVRTRPFFLPAISAHKQIRMLLPFRVEPLGGTVQVATGGQWTLTSEGGP